MDIPRLPQDDAIACIHDRVTSGQGIFGPKSRTDLGIVTFALDDQAPNVPENYIYLTGDEDLEKYVHVDTGDAVHSMIFYNPRDVLEAIADKIELP